METLESVPRIAVDESGNTGEDLFNPEQPIYVIGSTSLTEDQALVLIRACGWDSDEELKFSSLKNSRRGRSIILEIMRRLSPSTAKAAVVHKPFMITAKLVDELIEPLAASTGFNIYDRGTHVALVETWYHAMRALIGYEAYDGLLRRFVAMYRSPSKEAVDAFYGYAANIAVSAPSEVRGDMELIGATRDLLQQSLSTPRLSDALDPAIPCLFATAIAWGRTLGTPFIFDHDEAAAIERWMPNLERFLFSDREPVQIGAGARSFTLPLLAVRVDFVDSAHNRAVQIADLVTGTTRAWMSARTGHVSAVPTATLCSILT